MDEHLNGVRLMAEAAGSKFLCEESNFCLLISLPCPFQLSHFTLAAKSLKGNTSKSCEDRPT
jgi:glutathionyl-hydroquinone reductase